MTFYFFLKKGDTPLGKEITFHYQRQYSMTFICSKMLFLHEVLGHFRKGERLNIAFLDNSVVSNRGNKIYDRNDHKIKNK